nr:MAG TPA: hypothetical protein [Caudoviricetes sp.]
MNDLELQIRVLATVKNYIGNLMGQNQISASLMENVLNSVMLDVKDAARQELAASLLASAAPQEVEDGTDEDKEVING